MKMVALCVAFAGLASTVTAQTLTLTNSLPLPPGFTVPRTQAFAASTSLGALVGRSYSANAAGTNPGAFEAALWLTPPAVTGLGLLPSTGASKYSAAWGISADGSVIAGLSTSDAATGTQAFRWTQASGLVGLGDLSGGAFNSAAFGMTPDGSVIVGYGTSLNGSGVSTNEAFRWTQAGGMVGLGRPNSAGLSLARGISADGTTIVGAATPVGSPSNTAYWPHIWRQGTGWQQLGTSSTGILDFGTAFAANHDGSIVVGVFNRSSLGKAFIWKASDNSVIEITGSNFTPNTPSLVATGVTDDGSFVVGHTTNTVNNFSPYVLGDRTANSALAFIWDETNGLRRLDTYLHDAGVAFPTDDPNSGISDFRISECFGVSGDGTVFWGTARVNGSSFLGFIVTLPRKGACCLDEETCIIATANTCASSGGSYKGDSAVCNASACAPSCPADFNGDHVRDVADLFGYINAWLAKTTNADFNHDTLVDVADLFGYINAWLAGC